MADSSTTGLIDPNINSSQSPSSNQKNGSVSSSSSQSLRSAPSIADQKRSDEEESGNDDVIFTAETVCVRIHPRPVSIKPEETNLHPGLIKARLLSWLRTKKVVNEGDPVFVSSKVTIKSQAYPTFLEFSVRVEDEKSREHLLQVVNSAAARSVGMALPKSNDPRVAYNKRWSASQYRRFFMTVGNVDQNGQGKVADLVQEWLDHRSEEEVDGHRVYKVELEGDDKVVGDDGGVMDVREDGLSRMRGNKWIRGAYKARSVLDDKKFAHNFYGFTLYVLKGSVQSFEKEIIPAGCFVYCVGSAVRGVL